MSRSASARHLCEWFEWTCSALNGIVVSNVRTISTRAGASDHLKRIEQHIREQANALLAPQVTEAQKMQEFRESLQVLRAAMPTLDSIPVIHQPKFQALSVENPPEFLLRLLTIISQHTSAKQQVQSRAITVTEAGTVTYPSFLQRSLEAVARADEFLSAQLGEEGVVARGEGSVQQDPEEAPEATLEELRRWLEYAEAAYDEMGDDEKITEWLQERGYTLEIASRDNKAHCPVFFVAVNEQQREVVIAVRGTMTLSDVVTDMIVTPDTWGSEELTVHSGIGGAAKTIFERIEALVMEHVAVGHSVVVVGHSLGAGSAALLAWLLREKAGIQDVRAFAFATPPCASPALAAQTKAYVTSCVMRDDAVPRITPRSMIALQELTLALSWEEMEECSKSWGFMGNALLSQAQKGIPDPTAEAGDTEPDTDAPPPMIDDTTTAETTRDGSIKETEEPLQEQVTDEGASNWSSYYSKGMHHASERAAEFFRQFKPTPLEHEKSLDNPLMPLVDALNSAGIIPGATFSSMGTTSSKEAPKDAAVETEGNGEASAAPADSDAAQSHPIIQNQTEEVAGPAQVMLLPVVPGTIVFLRPKPLLLSADATDEGAAASGSAAEEEATEVPADAPVVEFDRLLIDAKDAALAVLRVNHASMNDHFLNQYRLGLGMELVGENAA